MFKSLSSNIKATVSSIQNLEWRDLEAWSHHEKSLIQTLGMLAPCRRAASDYSSIAFSKDSMLSALLKNLKSVLEFHVKAEHEYILELGRYRSIIKSVIAREKELHGLKRDRKAAIEKRDRDKTRSKDLENIVTVLHEKVSAFEASHTIQTRRDYKQMIKIKHIAAIKYAEVMYACSKFSLEIVDKAWDDDKCDVDSLNSYSRNVEEILKNGAVGDFVKDGFVVPEFVSKWGSSSIAHGSRDSGLFDSNELKTPEIPINPNSSDFVTDNIDTSVTNAIDDSTSSISSPVTDQGNLTKKNSKTSFRRLFSKKSQESIKTEKNTELPSKKVLERKSYDDLVPDSHSNSISDINKFQEPQALVIKDFDSDAKSLSHSIMHSLNELEIKSNSPVPPTPTFTASPVPPTPTFVDTEITSTPAMNTSPIPPAVISDEHVPKVVNEEPMNDLDQRPSLDPENESRENQHDWGGTKILAAAPESSFFLPPVRLDSESEGNSLLSGPWDEVFKK